MQPLGFLALMAGAVLLVAGVSGSTIPSVAKGAPDKSKAAGPEVPAEGVGGGTPLAAGAASSGPEATPTGNVSETQFASAVLNKLGVTPTRESLGKMLAWMKQEGGNWHNDARYNPLNTTLSKPGAGNTGTQGNIKVYTSWAQGIEATTDTLQGYPQIIAALRSGTLGQFKSTVSSSAWGTKF
jgi:hypothetical protein